MSVSAEPGINRIGFGAPFAWLAGGARDFLRAFAPCLAYGALVTAASVGIWWSLVTYNLPFWALALSCGFVFVAPMLGMGLYEAGRALESGERPRFSRMVFVREAMRVDVFYLGLALLLIYLLWGRIAQVVYGLSTYRLHKTVKALFEFAVTTGEGHTMLITGTIVGGVMAFFTFAIVVVSAPMLLHRGCGVFEAIFTSFQAVFLNFGPMLLWAVLITVLLLAAAATGFLGLVVIFPCLGLASWRAYRSLVIL